MVRPTRLTRARRSRGPSKLSQNDAAAVASHRDPRAIVERERKLTTDQRRDRPDSIDVHQPAAVNEQEAVSAEVLCETRDRHSAPEHGTSAEVNPDVIPRRLHERDLGDAEGHLFQPRFYQHDVGRSIAWRIASHRVHRGFTPRCGANQDTDIQEVAAVGHWLEGTGVRSVRVSPGKTMQSGAAAVLYVRSTQLIRGLFVGGTRAEVPRRAGHLVRDGQ